MEDITYVYFVYDKRNKRTKIGKSKNVINRIQSLLTANPDLLLIYYTSNYSESYYHELFKNKRIIGEWFDLDLNDYKLFLPENVEMPHSIFYKKTKILEKYIKKINTAEMLFIKEFPGYYFDRKKLFSKAGREIRLTVLNYTKGYWIGKKFLTINKLKGLTYYKEFCPF